MYTAKPLIVSGSTGKAHGHTACAFLPSLLNPRSVYAYSGTRLRRRWRLSPVELQLPIATFAQVNCERLAHPIVHRGERHRTRLAACQRLTRHPQTDRTDPPAGAPRDSGIAAVLLMDAQIDHVTGLPMLRERQTPLPLLATPEVLSDLFRWFPHHTHPVPLLPGCRHRTAH
ncbi:MAG: MBL fold metallo-hydrolase [Burkholderiaceae bacterium]